MPVLEIGLMGVKPAHSVMDATTPEGQILKTAWNSVTTYPTGPHWSYGGVEANHPDKLWGFFAFDSIPHHEEFARTFGIHAVKDLPKILSSQAFQKHIEFEGDMRTAFDAPVTQILLTYFPASTTESEKSAIKSKANDIITSGLASCADATGAVCGWSVEDDFPVLEGGEKEGEKGYVFAVFIGWTGVDAAERFWDGKDYEREFEGIAGDKEVEMVERFVQVRKFGERVE